MKWSNGYRMRLVLAGFFIAVLSMQPAVGSDFVPFVDDFEDGSVSDDLPVSVVSAEIPVSIEISNGDMILTQPLQLEGYLLFFQLISNGL